VDGKKLWAADIPEVREGKWYFRELWVNGERRVRARHPNKGYFKIEAVPDKATTWADGQKRFQFHEGDLKAWSTVTNAEVVSMSRWIDSRLPVTSVDESQRIVNFGKRTVAEFKSPIPISSKARLRCSTRRVSGIWMPPVAGLLLANAE